MNKILIGILIFAILSFAPIAFLFAQETTLVSKEELLKQIQETINQLIKKIAQLQAQIQELINQQVVKEKTEATQEEVIKEKVVAEEVTTTTSELATTTQAVADTTAPANVSNFTAKVDIGSAVFAWANPSNGDFAGTKIVKKWWSEPRDVYDGTQIYDGTATSTADYGLFTGINYYYKAFTYDKIPNYSSGTLLKFTSTSTATITVTSVTAAPTSGGTATVGTETADTVPPAISNFQPSGTTTDNTPTISFNTDEPATCRYASTTDKSYDTMPADTLNKTSAGTYHYSTLNSMANGTHTFYARCQDTAGNKNAASASTTFTVAAGIADVIAPVISNIQTTNTIASSTTLTWQTNEESDSIVNYGLAVAYGSTASGAAGVTYHEVRLSNLTSNTTYHYKVSSTDASGNKAESQDKTFTTLVLDTAPPVISNIQASNITQTSAAITWTTNEPADSKVNYSLTSPITTPTTITDTNQTTSHTINLTNLTSNTKYYYTIASTDSSNNPAVSTEQSFTTLSPQPISANTGSIDLENSSGENQFLSISDNVQNGFDITGDMTIESWIKLESKDSTINTIVGKYGRGPEAQDAYRFYWSNADDSSGSYYGYDLNNLTERFKFFRTLKGGGYGMIESASVSYPQALGTWTHVAAVFGPQYRDDGSFSGYYAIFYINGVKQLRVPPISSTGADNGNVSNADLNVGADRFGTVNFFDGKIDEVRVWNLARTNSEIRDNYNKELAGNEPGLVGYWRFNNELVNGKAKDETSNHNDLILNNNPTFSTEAPF